jgi:hypothetical protein
MPEPIVPTAVGALVKAGAEVAPEFKEELGPAAQELGKALTTLGKAINVALAPLSLTVWGYERIADYLRTRLEEKLSSVAPEKITAPPTNVAGPALEAMRFTGDTPQLREMYASLLATAMNADTAGVAHPAFVEIIKQLNQDEAKILAALANRRYRPVINVFARLKAQQSKTLATRCQSMLDEEAGISRPDLFPTYIDNLIRLGLVEIPDGQHLTQPGIYDQLLASKPIVDLIAEINATETHTAEVERRFLRLRSLGEQFVAICLPTEGSRASDA